MVGRQLLCFVQGKKYFQQEHFVLFFQWEGKTIDDAETGNV